MTLPLVLCLIATVIPVFFARVGQAPTWLSLQAMALGWIALTPHEPLDSHAAMAGLEVLVVRAWLAPTLLRRALASAGSAHAELMPSNLFVWGTAIAAVILAFKFGDGARADVRALTLGAVAATTTMAFMILATNPQPGAQLVALMLMENALALFETQSVVPWPLAVHLAVTGVYVLTVGMGCWLVRTSETGTGGAIEEATENRA